MKNLHKSILKHEIKNKKSNTEPHYYHCIVVFTRNHSIANTLQGFHVTNINLEEH